jgi:hypothetical protein
MAGEGCRFKGRYDNALAGAGKWGVNSFFSSFLIEKRRLPPF